MNLDNELIKLNMQMQFLLKKTKADTMQIFLRLFVYTLCTWRSSFQLIKFYLSKKDEINLDFKDVRLASLKDESLVTECL